MGPPAPSALIACTPLTPRWRKVLSRRKRAAVVGPASEERKRRRRKKRRRKGEEREGDAILDAADNIVFIWRLVTRSSSS